MFGPELAGPVIGVYRVERHHLGEGLGLDLFSELFVGIPVKETALSLAVGVEIAVEEQPILLIE